MANVTKTVDASPSEQNIGDLVTELLKIVKSTNTPSDPVTTTYANYVHIDEEFASNASNHSSIDFGYWIIDTGATNHICADITMFASYAKPSHKHSVHLPDGTQKPVLYVGTVKLSDNFVLDNDQASRKTLALGTLYEKLYVLNRASFNVVHPSSPPVMSCFVSRCTDVVWHRRLGHASMRASLPNKFWGDAILTATHLINRTPSQHLRWKSPFQILYDKVPPYDHLWTFGSLCFVTVIDPQRAKFHKRALRCILLGYAPNKKAYKLYDLENHHTVISRDVLFHEDVFPFDTQQSSTTCPLPIPSTPDTHLDYPIPSTQSTVRPLLPLFKLMSRFLLLEPRSFAEASKSKQWREAMNSELAALEHNNTWIVTPLPEGKKAIGCKWVYKLKLNADGIVDRHKARLVAKGYNQIEGVDYVDYFSPVAKTVTVRVFLAIAAAHNWPIHQLDAFLHGHLEEDIYMLPPEGSSVPSGMVCKLARSLYGLKQASRQWNLEFSSKLALFGFRQSSHDYCLFIKHTELGSLFLLVYVDDVLLIGPSMELMQEVKTYLHELFTIKDMGAARYFLGLEIARSTSGSYVAQTKYVLDIVHDAGLSNAKGVSTPFPQGLKLSSDCGALLPNPDSYRRIGDQAEQGIENNGEESGDDGVGEGVEASDFEQATT
ncbi:UNVERIFIED_CONTAM: Retrovirus-related Pol polyprotein from transposon RE1 [Sesamum radiatum]|uniref:Retrovirus-related Pol polyprotein from transposon RE1 n=1 Tax=Sesamum radiatum TaxID=300843 RepID=A0AAW2UNY0_SESRA